MKKFWDQLKPQERRWVIIIGVIVFVVLNYFMVFPRFGEWKLNAQHIKDADDKISKYQVEINRASTYQKELAQFDPSEGVPLEEAAYNFVTFYQQRAVENGVQIVNESPRAPKTNEFFMERQASIEVIAGESNLVGFLYSLGSSGSQMRVRSMNLHPVEPNRYKLRASLTIIANYARKTPAATTKAGAAAVPDLKPGANAPKATNPVSRLIPPTNKPALTQTNKPGPAPPTRRGPTPTNKPAPPRR